MRRRYEGRHRLVREPHPATGRWFAVLAMALVGLSLLGMLAVARGPSLVALSESLTPSPGRVVAAQPSSAARWGPLPPRDDVRPKYVPPPTTSTAPPQVTVVPAPTTTVPAPEPEPERPADVELEPVDEPQSSPRCEGLEVAVNVERACVVILAAVPGVTVVGGRAARPGNPTSCHPKGLALDLMTYKDKELGDRLKAYAVDHKDELGITTILWQVPDHYDHVHLSFEPCTH